MVSVEMTKIEPNYDVLWLGGSPCSGKSTITDLLAERHDIAVYHVDDALYQQPARVDPKRHPALAAWMAASCDDRWLKPVDELLADAIACYAEHFSLILEDLNAMPTEQITLAEGTALLPHLVAILGTQPDHALWMTPLPSFQMEHYSKRPWVEGMLAECTDPARAFANWMERDTQFAEWVAGEATRLGFPVLQVDGCRTIEENASGVADHFGINSRGSRIDD